MWLYAASNYISKYTYMYLYMCSSVTVGVKGKESQQRVIMTLWLQRLGEILITPDILQNCWVAWGCMGCLWCWGTLGAGFLYLWLVGVLGFGNV